MSAIPALRGDTLEEVAFAQGRECATSRAWQVEVHRRRGEARLAALFGPAGAPWDVFATKALLPRTARRCFEALTPEAQALFTAYVDGVNAALADGASAPELDRRGVVPEPWQPWTPVGIFLAAHVLFAQFPDKLWKGAVEQAGGPELLDALLPAPGPLSGSNALALTGARTVSGLPLVTGDPHRTFEAPNAYAQVRLTTPEFDVAGFTFPGVPGVQHFAHAGPVAWAITNAMADYQDLYAETLERSEGGVRALGPTGWEDCEASAEQVDVAGGPPVDVEVVETPRGPVVLGELSLRTASYALGQCGLDAIPQLLRARTVADVEAAFARWVEPVNNLVAADVHGAVTHRVVGRVPQRARSRGPAPANDPAYGWTGWVELPSIGPVDGAVVTANDRVDAGWDAVGADFAAAFRANRIRERLAARERWSAGDVHEVLMDVRQTEGAGLLDQLRDLDALTTAGAALRERLLAWDREMTAESSDVAAFVALREAVVEGACALPQLAAVRAIESPDPLYAAWFNLRARVATGLHRFLEQAPGLGVDVAALVRTAVEQAALAPTVSWRDRHRFAPLTPSAYVGLDDLNPDAEDAWVDVLGTPLDGDAGTVRVTGVTPGTPDSLRGSVARYVWDLADRSRSRWAVPLGPGGHDTSQFEAWRTGRMLEIGP